MKVIRYEELTGLNDVKFKELEVEVKFLFITSKRIYRNFDGNILRFEYPNKYWEIGISEFIKIRSIFSIPFTENY